MTADLFVSLLKHMMRGRRKPLNIELDSLPAHKAKMVQDYVASTNGRLELHFLPGYAPELNPDEFVWNHVKRTGTAKGTLAKGDNLQDRIEADLLGVQANPRLVRSFFKNYWRRSVKGMLVQFYQLKPRVWRAMGASGLAAKSPEDRTL